MNRAFGERPTPNTLYQIGSITKVFTDMLLGALRDDGLVENDTLVAHGGEVDGFSSFIAFLSKYAVGIFVLTNYGQSTANNLTGPLWTSFASGLDLVTRAALALPYENRGEEEGQ